MWGERGASCESHYAASKAALIGLAKSLALELGPSGIRVNCVAPGVIDTDMNAMHGEDVMQSLADETPLERVGRATKLRTASCISARKRRPSSPGRCWEWTADFNLTVEKTSDNRIRKTFSNYRGKVFLCFQAK